MLSKLSRLIMGLLWTKPMNPYELTKLLNMAVIQDWFPLTAPSIYTTIKNLEEKGYLIGETIREGKLPPKTIYSLSENGKMLFSSELLSGLESYESAATDFGIALFHIGAMDKKDAIHYTRNRIEHLELLLDNAQKRLEQCIPKVPFNMKMMLTCNVYRLETELKVTKELLDEIMTAKDWDTSFVQFL